MQKSFFGYSAALLLGRGQPASGEMENASYHSGIRT